MREKTVDVACGRDHTLALTLTGSLFAWGSNKDGRLGVGHTQTLYEPDRLSLSFPTPPLRSHSVPHA
jgi:alpha-tubulin suppressor-like RCC1 family protein